MRVPNEQGHLGQYDSEAEELLVKHNAAAVVVVIIAGVRGSGFSVSTREPRLTNQLPEVLEELARSIREQLQKNQGN